MKKAYYKNKKYFLSGLFIAIAVFAVASPKIANADVFDFLKNASVALVSSPILLSLGTISVLCVAVCGTLNGLIISALINISKYNNFIHETTIVGAWVVVRDLCNMFFILILLVIAFTTILRVEGYQWKKMLPKLLIMAVLINFSRTICGLIIDGSQIIMLTFVNAWANAGDFVDIMGMAKYFHGNMFDNFGNKDWSVLKVVTGMIVGIMFLIISMIVLLVAMAVFLIRVVMLWIYIVLSPIAFLLAAFPAGQKYASQWWSEFMRYIINGPVLAFFIWMAIISKGQIQKIGGLAVGDNSAGQCFGITEISCFNNFLPWIISVGMLLGGLIITQQIGGIGASMAGKGMGWIKGMASMPVGVGKKAGKLGLKGAKELGSWGVDKASIATKGKFDFNLFRTWGRLKAGMENRKKERAHDIGALVAAEAKAGGRGAMITHGDLGWQNFSNLFTSKGKREKQAKGLEELENKRKTTMTQNEYNGKMAGKVIQLKQYQNKVNALKNDVDTEQNPKKKQKLQQNLNKAKEKMRNFSNNDYNPFDRKEGLTIADEQTVKKLDEDIATGQKWTEEHKIKGADTVAAESTAKMISEQEKKITHVDNSEQLGQILKGALKEGNQGLIAAVARKMTKLGDYNELCRLMKVGTGVKGMQALAKKFEKSGMSTQSSRGLIAEMGGMCKNLGQFGAFGAMEMDKNGNWQEQEDEDKAQAAQLNEMMKMGPQEFARNVGRMGFGYYDDPSGEGKQTAETWKMSKAGVKYIVLNQEPLARHYEDRGMQHSIEHLASATEQLARNGAEKNIIHTIEKRNLEGGGADMASHIASFKE